MNIKGIVPTDEGNFEITVEANSEQHKFIFEAGMKFLLATGAIPTVISERKAAGLVLPDESEDGEVKYNA